jgi:hypothetical protein
VLTYIVPLRRWRTEPVDELAEYLNSMSAVAEVIVVDGSAPPIFAHHHRHLGPAVRHVPVDPARTGRSGKVNGVLTGVDLASHERLVIADDDVRYDHAVLSAVADRLADADLVRPQNHFAPCPWHAHWDTARSLLNRSLWADYPGTLAVRRSVLRRSGGYDADVLFENLELMRTVAAVGGCVRHAPDLYVRRTPPTTSQFLSQRVRHAYDSSATPLRWAFELALLPALVLVARRRPPALLVAAGAAIALAERGRRRQDGRRVFSPWGSVLAPCWLLERAACAWLALGSRARGGVRYAGGRFSRSANSRRELARRHAASRLDPAAPSPHPPTPVPLRPVLGAAR